MIHTCVPYAPEESDNNLGAAYNSFMSLLPEEDWACFIDHDAMFTTGNWYRQLEQIVRNLEREYPDAGLLTACTNRIGNSEQIVFRKSSPEALDHDIMFHRAVGRQRQKEYGLQLREAKRLISGVVILISKKIWLETKGFSDGFLKVDVNMDRQIRDLGYKTFIMDGVYCYHYYRADDASSEARGYSDSKKLPLTVLKNNYKRNGRINTLAHAKRFLTRLRQNLRLK